MKLSTEVKGVKQLIGKINAFELKKKERIKKVISEYGHIIEGQAKALAPVDTGNLKNSMTLNFDRGGLTAEISNSSEYAPYVEFGTGIFSNSPNSRKTPWVYYSDKLHRYVTTSGMRAQPFLFPAYDMNKRAFLSDMKKAVEAKE